MNVPENNSSETPSEKPTPPRPKVSGPYLIACMGVVFTLWAIFSTPRSLENPLIRWLIAPFGLLWQIMSTIPDSPTVLLAIKIIIGGALMVLYPFFIYYGLIQLWLKASRHMRITLGVIGAVAIVIHYSLAHYRDSVDWTSRGLDPERPGFRPAVVWLSGTISYWRETSSGTRRGEGRFDIIMRGTNHFYFNRWRGKGNVGGDFEEVSSVCEGYAGDWVRRNRGHGTGGGGGHHQGHESRMSPIFQGMWRKDTFVGLEGFANTNYHGRKPHLVITETMTVAPYQLPKTFVINSDGGSQTLHVRKVEFLPNPDTNWFIQVFNRRFNRIAITNSLNPPEPGWNLRSR